MALMPQRPRPDHPVPAPRPNPDLHNWIYGPPPPRRQVWLINGVIGVAGLVWLLVFMLLIARRTCGLGVVC